MYVEKLLFLIPLLPFLGFIANGAGGRRLPREAVSAIGCAAPALAFLLSLLMLARVAGAEAAELPLRNSLGTWIASGDLSVPFAFAADRLSAVMALVVTGVGTLIHVYSIGYMKGDPGYARYFAFLNLFLAAMLVLVLADNVVLLFLGWEGVGLCSYLLIGFWYRDLHNCAAGIKAFVVNRVGDLAFLIGIFWIFVELGSFEFTALNAAAETADPSSLFWIALLLFIGATGKSAQIPLHVWLPDAMAGPTPVSALIHAATMVTSGVYLLARLGGLFTAAPAVLTIVATAGAATALAAAVIAFSQTDIKKVLAYSTISQLGYMFLAAGVGAFGVAMFHVVTHAFFKALLFLGAGAVIHALHHEQDMRRMGGLMQRIPHTAVVFTVGAVALAGLPLTAGYFSKDEVLHAVHARGAEAHGLHGAWILFLWIIGLLTAFLTAVYTFRQVALVFFGSYRGSRARERAPRSHDDASSAHHGIEFAEIQEPPLVMRVPLYVLAVLSVLGGFFAVPRFLGIGELHEDGKALGLLIGAALSIGGIATGIALWLRRRDILETISAHPIARALAVASRKELWFDEVYGRFVSRPLFTAAEILFYLVDRFLIDFVLVGGAGFFARSAGTFLRGLQTGRLPAYAMLLFGGVLVFMLISWWHLP